MSLEEIKSKYKKDSIDKWQYIDEMYKVHQTLFEYSKFIGDSNISKIEIEDGRVIMTFRDSGIKFICSESDKRLAPLDTLNFGTYEQEEFQMQCKLIVDGQNILDIGGNFGWYCMHMAARFKNSTVFSFEPVPSTYQFLKENIVLNQISNIKPFNFGFAEEEGTFDLYFDPKLSVNASLANLQGGEGQQKVECKIKKLDDFIKEENLNIDFIKCDVEGAELMVYKGGREFLREQKPIVFSEILRKWTAKFSYEPNDILRFFEEMGYGCFTLKNNKLSAFSKVTDSTIETNYFFLHNEKHADKIQKYSA